MALPEYQIKANEQFFTQMIEVLREDGKWIWKDKPHLVFTKKDGKLRASDEGYQAVAEIVSDEFVKQHFIKE